MRVLLINPPSAFLLDDRVFPSLGILKVAASLEAAGHEVAVLDLSGLTNYLDALRDYLSARTDDAAIGITATTPQMPSVMEIVCTIRSASKARIILGGPHATLMLAAKKQEIKRDTVGRGHRAFQVLLDTFDVVVTGDGEYSIHEALADSAPNLLDGDDRKSAYWLKDADYEALPLPARHLIDLPSYRYSIEGHSATSMIAQLGCPFHCGFCGGRNSPSLRFIRTRSAEKIIEEVRHLHETYGYTAFMFYDDEMNVNPGLVGLMEDLTRLQDELGVEFRLRGFVKSELFTVEQARAMYTAGFRWLLCGFEGADDRILTNIRKRATLADNTRTVDLAKEAGLKVKALMSIGHPGESFETIKAVADWLVRVAADDFDCTVITPFPGTPYHDEALFDGQSWVYTQPQTGDRLYSDEVNYATTAEYYKGVPGSYISVVHTDYLSKEEIIALRDELEASVRQKLGIPFNPGAQPTPYEHSMGQGLPPYILKQSEGKQ